MKTFFKVLLLVFCIQSYAQVGINTTTPGAQLDIKASNQATPSNTDGILIPRVDAFPAINPTATQQGMIVYLMVTSGANLPGLYYWDNITTSWVGISSTANGDKDWYKVGTTTAPSAITDDMFHDGKVGIGNTNPFTKLHVMNNSSGMTPNVESVATLENNTNAFLNILSAAESGVIFGANGDSTNGGIIYNPFGLPNRMLFRTNGNVNRMVISDVGNVGIGLINPLTKLHVKNNSSGMTPNTESVATLENDTNAFLNILSAASSGVIFGANGNSTNGGIIYNPSYLPNSMLFRTNGNANRMVIDDIGNVALGNFPPNHPLHFPSTGGDKIALWGGTGPHFGLGIGNSLLQIHSDVAVSDIAFGYGSSAAFTERMRIKGNGNVGIGETNPLNKFHIKTVDTGITPNPLSSAVIEDDDYTFLNLLSNQESGILFGSIGNATSGAIVYSPASMPNTLQFRTNTNLNRMTISDVGNVAIGNFKADYPLQFATALGDKISLYGGTGPHVGFGVQGNLLQIHSDFVTTDVAFGYGSSTSFNENMRVKGNGNVGIGTTTPDYPLQFKSALGDKISLWGGAGNHFGFGVQGNLMQIHSDIVGSDIAFGYGSSAAFTEKMRIKGTGEVGIGTPTPTAELEVNGFTKLGTTAPAIKVIKLTGTTSALQGISVSLAHGLTSSKILAVNILVEYIAGSSVPPSYTASAGFEYDYYINGGNLVILNKAANSANILSKPIRVLVTYEE